MDLVDEEGRLFGYVNVIDALVVLLALAVLLAGFALLFGAGPAPTDRPEYVTLTFGPVSDDAVQTVADAENFTSEERGATYNVSDTFVTAHPTQDAAVVVKRVRTPATGEAIPIGTEVFVQEGPYTLNATVSSPGNRSTIPTDTTRVLINTRLSSQVASAISVGDTYRIGNASIAEVVSTYPLNRSGGSSGLLVGLELHTRQQGSTPSFARQKMTLGAQLPFRTGTYSFAGSIRERNVDSMPAVESRTVQVQTTVSSSVAATIQAGQTFDVFGQRMATIESVRSFPTGTVGERRLRLELSLRTIRLENTVQFMGRPVRIGSTVPIQTGDATISPRIIGFGSAPGTEVRATLHVQWEGVRPGVSDDLRPGLSESHRGAEATVTSVEREPATVILESEGGQIFAREHPVKEDVELQVEVTGRQTEDGFVFHGRPVQAGSSVVLDFGSVTVQGTVTAVEEG